VRAGITQLTVFDKNGVPKAERLVFLHPHKKLHVELKKAKQNYLPREKVTMDVSVKDEEGNLAAGQFSLAVADDQLLTFADDKQGNILGVMWLEAELKGEVIAPNFYFENKEKHPKKDQLLALDYLMMTQGWRRFDWSKKVQTMADFEYKNERRIIGGIIKGYQEEPLAGVTMSLQHNKGTIVTDSTGRFVFKNPILVRGQTFLKINKGNLEKKQWIHEWKEDYVFRLFEHHNFELFYEANADKSTKLSGKVMEADTGEPVILVRLLCIKMVNYSQVQKLILMVLFTFLRLFQEYMTSKFPTLVFLPNG
jgi:hypothetical protein